MSVRGASALSSAVLGCTVMYSNLHYVAVKWSEHKRIWGLLTHQLMKKITSTGHTRACAHTNTHSRTRSTGLRAGDLGSNSRRGMWFLSSPKRPDRLWGPTRSQFNRYRGSIPWAGITTHYGLDGPGIESRWRRDFPHPVQTGSGAHPASYVMGTGSFPGVKRPGRGVDHPPTSSAEVKVRVQLYLYPPLLGLRGPF